MNIVLKKPVVYVTRDIERALGMEPGAGYSVVSNDTPFGREVRSRFPSDVFLAADPRGTIDTYDLLLLPEVEAEISRRGAAVLVFQSTARIERLAAERGWELLNPSAALARRAEEKISQIAFLGEDAALLPPHRVAEVKDVEFDGKRFVLQFNHSHTGEGTHVVDSPDKLAALKERFPKRDARVVEFVEGPIFTVNAVVSGTETLVGNPSYQITGLPAFTDFPFSTIGNDWELPRLAQYERAYADTLDIARRVGARLAAEGWKGLFGIDVVFDEAAQRTHLLEINARQPASTAYESSLQTKGSPGSPTAFEAHLAALCGLPVPGPLAQISSGSQIVKRKTERDATVDVEALKGRGISVIAYETDIPNKELYRIQSDRGIMKAHAILNDLGAFIASCIK